MPIKSNHIYADYLRERLSYNPETGDLKWKAVSSSSSIDSKQVRRRNSTWAGKVAGKLKTFTSGYKCITLTIDGKEILAHRACWAIHTGKQPPHSIDHLNGDGTDNRWVNMVSGEDGVNEKNQCLPKNNTSGICGVTWRKRDSKWQARITVNKKHIYLGLFDDLEDAKAARALAEKKYGFSDRHGTPRMEKR